MEKVDIQATITESKLAEFNQSKQAFLDGLQSVEGYVGYTENPGSLYGIRIEWENRRQLDNFLNSELFKFIHGAIITLGILRSITVISEKDKSIINP